MACWIKRKPQVYCTCGERSCKEKEILVSQHDEIEVVRITVTVGLARNNRCDETWGQREVLDIDRWQSCTDLKNPDIIISWW